MTNLGIVDCYHSVDEDPCLDCVVFEKEVSEIILSGRPTLINLIGSLETK